MPLKNLSKLLIFVLFIAAILGGFWGLGQAPVHQGPREGERPVFSKTSVEIQTANGRSHSFSVEVATTPEQQEYGLMFRQDLPVDEGMLFVYDPPQIVSFWMKNTQIPLDMLFLRADGEISKIITRAEPFDLTIKSSDYPVGGVLEIGGGEAEHLGIAVGDRVLYDLDKVRRL